MTDSNKKPTIVINGVQLNQAQYEALMQALWTFGGDTSAPYGRHMVAIHTPAVREIRELIANRVPPPPPILDL